MRKPGDEFIVQFRKKFGDLLLTCDGERGKGGAFVHPGDPTLPVRYANDIDFVGATQVDNTKYEQSLGLVSGSSVSRKSNAPDSLSPLVIHKKHKTSHSRNLPGSGAVFHNKAGDLHSPMIEWGETTAPFFDTSNQCTSPISWVGPDCFAPLAQTQHWVCDNTHYGQPDYIPGIFTLHDSAYSAANGLNHGIPTGDMSQKRDSMAAFEADITQGSPFAKEETFRYNVTLLAPTSIVRHTNERPVTYLNKGQIYSLEVVDPKPPLKIDGPLEYRTFVRVTFEEQDQRSDPVRSWELWKDGRGLNEAYKRQSELLAVEYVEPFQDSAKRPEHRQIRLERATVDGFCVTWIADPTTKVCKYAISLRFNFLSTDFSRSKGVKGVPVRLCAKTEILRSDGEEWMMEHDSEMCYCVIKLFRDHGAERKSSNDVAHVKKKIEKLNKEITDRELGVDLIGPNHGCGSMNGGQIGHRPQKPKGAIKSRKDYTTDEDLHAELAQTYALFQSAHEVSVLRFRGNERDDPESYPVNLPRGTNTMVKTGHMDNQQTESTSMPSASGNEGRLPKETYVQPDHLQSLVNPQRSPEIPTASIGALQDSPLHPLQSSKAGSYRNVIMYFSYTYPLTVACFYVQFKQNGKALSSHHHAIYLINRTSLELKEKLAKKVQIDPSLITHIFWEHSRGFKVMVDDNVVQHLPEAHIMTADIYDISQTEVASSGSKLCPVKVKLVF
ncbi:unnamed protein product [Penicillium salamii]|nr:unnamed protein product [Penicillium salamii]CAG8003834.1 unnamed protein product [Penicillium salamii]